ncbi:MarR family winged helix-turn-helix transcriptional regulator [Streptomyces sp. SL13]|uniref:MarR family winged helix-turn-helix transcriptional regulator n=1 Tax=Streptantibioticus silvisoli TaxID=2705255 RepID=A0AA90HG12_9ACTN|nr:MarR family winged helix-turn-helix transcriptional regulator [Streptantibioticus silvisoli]
MGASDRCWVNDLAREVAITVGATSKGVGRLEAAGWVSRRPNPENRRSSLLDLTPAGRRLLDSATPTFDNELRTWLADPLTAEALDQLATAVARLRGVVEEARAGMPTGCAADCRGRFRKARVRARAGTSHRPPGSPPQDASHARARAPRRRRARLRMTQSAPAPAPACDCASAPRARTRLPVRPRARCQPSRLGHDRRCKGKGHPPSEAGHAR